MAAANRVLKDLNKHLADDCLTQATRLWDEDKKLPFKEDTIFGKYRTNTELMAALQLFITTKDEQYSTRFKELLWPVLDKSLGPNISFALKAVSSLDDEYRNRLKDYVVRYKALNDGFDKENPYGVPISARGWAGNTIVIDWAITKLLCT